jgi:hypothetical protein
MKKALLASLAVAGLMIAALPARADGLLRRHHGHEECCAPCAPPCPPPMVEKTVTCYRPEWRTREVPCTVNRIVSHKVVENRQCTVNVPVWTTQKRLVTEYVQRPKVIEKEVVVCCKVPVAPPPAPCGECGTCDDCCGRHHHRLLHRGRDCGCPQPCPAPCYQTVQQVKKVCCTVMESCPVQREICCKVCTYRQEVRCYQVCRTVSECRPETVVHKECYCVMVPYQKCIKVPACCN